MMIVPPSIMDLVDRVKRWRAEMKGSERLKMAWAEYCEQIVDMKPMFSGANLSWANIFSFCYEKAKITGFPR